ncbi:MAG: inosine-5-monophosphate dehydrogenase, partial [Phenylobacterium sp.]|nr:inosine-5-monophosphate dehydrogenase [Phenylobacterium sp.]MCA6256122.1 inosine-5-monophosphate dehydrogenase [Phenylobacterium sp.]
MLVSQILRAKGDAVFTVTPADTVGRVAELLHSRRVGAFVVTKGETVV